MRRSVRVPLVAGAAVAALTAAPAPAHAATCIGISYDQYGPEEFGVWECDPCPTLIHGPLDGRFHVIACVDDPS